MNATQTAVTKARAQYLAWLREKFPTLYEYAVMRTIQAPPAAGLSGFLDSIGTVFGNVVKSVTTALPQLANTYSEYRQEIGRASCRERV